MKILVCGGRDFSDADAIYDKLDWLKSQSEISLVITGGATGADKIADRWAQDRGIDRCIFPYNSARGKSGGPYRNTLMLNIAKPDMVVAFPGGRGTESMKSLALLADVKVWDALAMREVA